MAIATPEWFDPEYYALQKVDQMNATAYGGRTDWTIAGLEAELGRLGQTAYESFLADITSGDPASIGISPNKMFNVQEYLLALADFANESGYSYPGYETGKWTAATAMRHMLEDFGVSPWEHYARAGQYDLVSPSNDLDTRAYYTDLAQTYNQQAVDGRTNWTANELARESAIAGITPIEQMTQNQIAATIQPTPVQAEARVTPTETWNPWTILVTENPSEPARPVAPSTPGSSGGSSSTPGNSGTSSPSQPGNSGSDTPNDPSTPGNSGSDTPNNPSGPGNSGSQTPSAPNEPGANEPITPDDPVTPPEPEVPTEVITLVTSKLNYQGSNGVNTIFEGEVNCDFGSFNQNTVIDGGDGDNTLRLKLTSLDRTPKGGSTTNVQNVELTNYDAVAQRTYDASKLDGVQKWTYDGSPIEVTNISNPEFEVTIKTLHGGGDAFSLLDDPSVYQGDDRFVTVNLGSAAKLNGAQAVVHSRNIRNIHLTATEDSGENVYIDTTRLQHLTVDTPRDFMTEINCTPATIEGSGVFSIRALDARGVKIDGGEAGCDLILPNELGGHTLFGTDLINVQKITLTGTSLGVHGSNGLTEIDYTAYSGSRPNEPSSVTVSSNDDGDFTLTQHLTNVDSIATINGVKNLDVLLTGKGSGDATFLAQNAASIDIVVDAAGSPVNLTGINTTESYASYAPNAQLHNLGCDVSLIVENAESLRLGYIIGNTVNIDATGVSGGTLLGGAGADGFAQLRAVESFNFTGSDNGSVLSWLSAKTADLTGGTSADSFFAEVSASAIMTGNGGADSFKIKNGGSTKIEVALNGEDNAASETFDIDTSGKAGMNIKITGFDSTDSLLLNGEHEALTANAQLLGQFGLTADIVTTNYAYNSSNNTAWGFTGSGNGLICIELDGVTEAEASHAFA